MSASGVQRGVGPHGDTRRRSSANTVGSFVFMHLEILKTVQEEMLKDEITRLHGFCAKVLVGQVDQATLAHHNDRGGRPLGSTSRT